MQIEKINKINDVKSLTLPEKIQLADEIRCYLLKIVSQNGGHLASNLGIVELTIALESIFDVTKDKIIWDVGHQCYVHKILTGRKDKLRTLRTFKGISGFPKTAESYTDVFNTGHSSTSISAAMGISCGRDLKGDNEKVIAVIGDGALTGGMALEALNHVGNSNTDIIVILNDNEMSISQNIGGMNKLLTGLRVKKNYTKSNQIVKNVVKRVPLIGSFIVNGVAKAKRGIKQLILPGMYFEEIGFRYLGPVDGHSISDMEDLFLKAKDLSGPTLIHVITKKGKGYKYAEETPEKFHGISKFNVSSGELLSKKKKDYSAVFGKKLISLASRNKKIVAITAAMKDGTGLTEFAKKFPERFFDVGIAEQHALTFAAGLAVEGMIPFISLYSSFYQRGFDQIIHDICLQNLPVIMCVDRAGVVGNDGPTHHGLFDLSFFRLIPNIVIMAPRDYKELKMMMDFSVTLSKPVVIRYPRGEEHEINYPCKKILFGGSDIIVRGSDITLITIGNSVYKGINLNKMLQEHNISSEIVNCRFLKPFDKKKVLNSINKTKKFVVIEDGTIVGGLCTTIKELVVDNNCEGLKGFYYAYPDKFIEHGSISELESEYGLDTESIFNDIINELKS